MKAKSIPEDFIVREIGAPRPEGCGRFALYRLRKRGVGTLEALHEIGRAWGVHRKRIGFAGLKDRWAVTEQTVSIADGPERDLETDRFRLEFLGRSREPLRRGRFEGNAFEITLRDLSEGDATHLKRGLQEIRDHGLPNYFDSQRFGSSRGTGDFIGRRLIRGDFEGALRLALATPTSHDRGGVRRTKAIVKAHWGEWEKALQALPDGVYPTRILRRLSSRPEDPRGAFEMIEPGLRQLYASAYQSYLWNETLKELLRASGTELFERKYEAGTLLFFRQRPPGLEGLQIPYLKSGAAIRDPRIRPAVNQVLSREGLRLADLKIRGLKGTHFPGGSRPALLRPRDLKGPEVAPDERNEGRLRGTFRMELPRGAYATLVIKRLFH